MTQGGTTESPVMGVNQSVELSRRNLLGSASTIAASMALAAALPRSAASRTSPEPLTAIDTLLDPDQTMVEKAIAANGRLRQSFPNGFALDETHRPHISTLQRYVRTADLDNVYGAVGKILSDEHPAGWKLTAYKYYFIPWKNIGLAGIVIRPTDDLRRFQQKLIDAIAPFTVKTGTAAAFVTTKDDPDINKPTIDYVAHYVPADSGAKFNPHVTIGVASQDFLENFLKEKFDEFTFSPAAVAVYHLGNFGTARAKLKSWSLT
jgi:hypothetical protein